MKNLPLEHLSFFSPPFQKAREAEEMGTRPKSQQRLLGPDIKRRNGEGLEGSSLPGTAKLSCHRSSGMTCLQTLAGWQERGCWAAWLCCTTPRTVLSIRGERRGSSGKMQTTTPGSSGQRQPCSMLPPLLSHMHWKSFLQSREEDLDGE